MMMGPNWKHFAVVIVINIIGHTLCNPLDGVFKYPDSDSLTDDIPHKHFARLSRALSSFVRIGKNDPDQEIYPITALDGDEENMEKRKSAFVRIGRGDFEYPDLDKRLSSFVRIGRDMEDSEPDVMEENKRGGAFVRMGKFPSSAFIRNRGGRIHSISPQPYYRRSGRIGHSSFIRIGKRDTGDALQQMAADSSDKDDYRRYIRLGKDLGEDESNMDEGVNENMKSAEEKRLSNFVRIGRPAYYIQPEELYRAYTNTDMSPIVDDKRMSKFVRIGKSIFDGPQKRLSSFVRIGKSELGSAAEKRLSQFVRIGKDFDELPANELEAEKRGLSKFVRIGKSDINKRKSAFVRIGKSNENMGIEKQNGLDTSD